MFSHDEKKFESFFFSKTVNFGFTQKALMITPLLEISGGYFAKIQR